jgi:hypothetical protein
LHTKSLLPGYSLLISLLPLFAYSRLHNDVHPPRAQANKEALISQPHHKHRITQVKGKDKSCVRGQATGSFPL